MLASSFASSSLPSPMLSLSALPCRNQHKQTHLLTQPQTHTNTLIERGRGGFTHAQIYTHFTSWASTVLMGVVSAGSVGIDPRCPGKGSLFHPNTHWLSLSHSPCPLFSSWLSCDTNTWSTTHPCSLTSIPFLLFPLVFRPEWHLPPVDASGTLSGQSGRQLHVSMTCKYYKVRQWDIRIVEWLERWDRSGRRGRDRERER